MKKTAKKKKPTPVPLDSWWRKKRGRMKVRVTARFRVEVSDLHHPHYARRHIQVVQYRWMNADTRTSSVRIDRELFLKEFVRIEAPAGHLPW